MDDQLPPPHALAEDDDSWLTLSRAASSPFIRSLDEFDAFIGNGRDQSPFDGLPAEAIERFRSHLRFVEVSVNGAPRRRFVQSFYMGDLVEQYGFSDDRVQEVAALFGIGPGLFRQLYHHFGDFGPGERIICRPRMYFYCGRYVP